MLQSQLEYACQVWNLYMVKGIHMLEAIKKHTAGLIHANRYNYPCIASLFDLIHLRYRPYVVSFNSYCSFKTITYLRSHSLSLKTIDSSISAYWYSYFVNILFWGTVCQLVLWYCLLPVNFNNLKVLILIFYFAK